MDKIELTLYRGNAGDRDTLAASGAAAVASYLGEILQKEYTVIGEDCSPLKSDWQSELAYALPELISMSGHLDYIFESRRKPFTAMSRCAVGLATLPVVIRHRPDACVVWFDAHCDLNTPETSQTGYLGGMVVAAAAGLWDSGLGGGLSLDNLILAGPRDIDPAEESLIDRMNIASLRPQSNFAERLRELIAGRPVYVHIDCDVFDAGIMPSEYQVPGGLTLNDFIETAQVLAESEIVGVELAEFQDMWEESGETVHPELLLECIRPLLN